MTSPAGPRWLLALPLTGVIADIALSGHYALVAAGHGGLYIVDVADPAAPRKVGQYQVLDPDQLRDIQVVARAAYVTGFGHLCMVDVSNPTQPTRAA